MNRHVRIFFKLTLITLLIGYSNLIWGKETAIEIELPVTQDLNLCTPSFVNLTATGSTGIYRWYSTPVGGNGILNPASIYISQNIIFYVAALQKEGNQYIESSRVPLTITIHPLAAPVADTIRICRASHNNMQASGASSNDVYCWYTDSLSSSPMKISADETDNIFYGFVDSTSTYYVSIRNNLGCESNRIKVPVYIKQTPSIPVVVSEPSICGSGNIRFEVRSDTNCTFLWYPCQTGCGYYINRGGSGPAYNESSFESYLYSYSSVSTFTIWVEKISLTNFCVSARVPLTATSYKVEPPAVPHTVYQCRNDIDTILAVIPSSQSQYAVLNWYSDKEKTQLLARGNAYIIPASIQKRTSVYAVVQDSMFHQCESVPEEGEIIIYPGEVPAAPVVSTDEHCGEVTFTVQQPANNGRYLWYTHDTIHAIHSGIQLMNYSDSEFASDAFYVCFETSEGCRGRRIRVEGHPLPILSPPSVLSAERCGPGVVQLKVTGNGKYTRYRWYTHTGYPIVGEYDAEYTTPYLYSSSGYSVSMIGDNGCESEKQEVQAIIKPGPSISASTDFVCRGESVALYGNGGNLYWWSENNITIANRNNIYVNPMVTTTYTLTDPTISGDCRSATITIRVNKNLECEALELESNFKGDAEASEYLPEGRIFPNPFAEAFSISSSFEGAIIRILDLTGKELYYYPPQSVDLNDIKPLLNPGRYILEIKTPDHIFREKLIKL